MAKKESGAKERAADLKSQLKAKTKEYEEARKELTTVGKERVSIEKAANAALKRKQELGKELEELKVRIRIAENESIQEEEELE